MTLAYLIIILVLLVALLVASMVLEARMERASQHVGRAPIRVQPHVNDEEWLAFVERHEAHLRELEQQGADRHERPMAKLVTTSTTPRPDLATAWSDAQRDARDAAARAAADVRLADEALRAARHREHLSTCTKQHDEIYAFGYAAPIHVVCKEDA